MDEKRDVNIALHDKTGALLMIDKKERRLVKEILAGALRSAASRAWIEKKLGKEYLEIGDRLLRSMGG